MYMFNNSKSVNYLRSLQTGKEAWTDDLAHQHARLLYNCATFYVGGIYSKTAINEGWMDGDEGYATIIAGLKQLV